MNTRLLERLRSLHNRLDRDIRAELARLAPNVERVATLKKVKLAVKDRLAGLGHGMPVPG